MRKHFGNLPLRRFSTLVVEEYQSMLMTKGLKPASVNKNVSIIKAMIRKAVDWRMVEEETLERIRTVKHLQENNARLRYLSKEECVALVDVCEAHLKPIVITALNTGMRRGEILSLKWDNVDLKHGFINLTLTKNGESRQVPINGTLGATLQGLERRLDIPYVFFDANTGKPYASVKRSFNTACRRAGILDFHFHGLRHTFASHLVMAGVDLTTVSRLLGHKTLTMTLRYSHLSPNHVSRAVDILDETIGMKPTSQLLHSLEGIGSVRPL
jgi:integrase